MLCVTGPVLYGLEVSQDDELFGIQNLQENGSLPCPQCGKVYKLRKSLAQHLRLECMMEPQFQCMHCSSKFKRNATLNRHLYFIHNIVGKRLKQGRPVGSKTNQSNIFMPSTFQQNGQCNN